MASLGNGALNRTVGHPKRTRATTMDTRRSHQVRLRFHAHHHAPTVNANIILRKQIIIGTASGTRTTFGCITPQGSVGDDRSRPGARQRGGKVGHPITRVLSFATVRCFRVIDLKDQTVHVRIAGVDAPEVRITRSSSEALLLTVPLTGCSLRSSRTIPRRREPVMAQGTNPGKNRLLPVHP